MGDTNALARAETIALQTMKNHLHRRYNITTIFAGIDVSVVGTPDDTRDMQLVAHAIHITLYILFNRIAKNKVPEDRYELYRDAMGFLKDTAAGKIDPDLPLRTESDGTISHTPIRVFGDPSTIHDY